MFPKKGTIVPRGDAYADAISKALLADFGTRSGATKIVMGWTGASSRSVKYWIAGKRGPDGRHLMMLMRHSDSVMRSVLDLSGREAHGLALELSAVRAALRRAIAIVDALSPDDDRLEGNDGAAAPHRKTAR